MNDLIQTQAAKRVVIYACSGCSDAGELADRTARVLAQHKIGEMSCLAGIGGRVKPLLNTATRADAIVAIDGCPLNCARHTLNQAGFDQVHNLELHRLGLRKGNCPVTENNLATCVQAGTDLIHSIVTQEEMKK